MCRDERSRSRCGYDYFVTVATTVMMAMATLSSCRALIVWGSDGARRVMVLAHRACRTGSGLVFALALSSLYSSSVRMHVCDSMQARPVHMVLKTVTTYDIGYDCEVYLQH